MRIRRCNIFFPCFGVFAVYAAEARIPERPNIIWLMAEDMGQDLGCYGAKGVKTPNLDRLASEGMLYMSAVCTGPISSPSRSAMMTGVHQNTINAHNHRSNRDSILDSSVQPITYHLRKNGYTCVLGDPSVAGGGKKTDCNFRTEPVGEWNGISKFGLFDEDNEFSVRNQPFFAQIQLRTTHRGDWWKSVTEKSLHPVDPDDVELPPYLPDHVKVREEWASYLDQVEFVDREVGQIMDKLEKEGLYDNTIIIFIGDNGRCEVKGKCYLYEPGIKIPMIVWGKGIRKSNVRDVVSTLDISATVMDLAGCELPSYLMGKPLLNKRTGRFTGGHKYAYSARDNSGETIDCIRSITTRRFKYIRNYMPERAWDQHQEYLDFHRPALHILRRLNSEGQLTDVQKQFLAETKPAEELYDLRKDPYELVNLADKPAYKRIQERMRGYMSDWQKKYRDYGLEDMDRRNPGKAGYLRSFVKEFYPGIWKNLTDGEIIDKYDWLQKEYRKYRKTIGNIKNK